MSIAVGLDELRAKIDEFTTDAYLLTVSDDGRAHSVAVPVRWDGDELVVPAGRTTRRNAAGAPARRAPLATARAWWLQPHRRRRHATRVDEDAGRWFEPTRAVLHRPAPSGDGSDCEPVL